MSRVTQSMYKALYFENAQLREENTKLKSIIDILKTHIADGKIVINRGVELIENIGDWEGCRWWLEYIDVINQRISKLMGW